MAAGERLSDVGEFGFLARMLPTLPQGPEVELGPGDDAAVLKLDGTRVVACTDVLVEGSHFRRDWTGGHEVGRKAAAVNMADLAAMGARTVAVLAGVAAPGELESAWLSALARGLAEESARVGASVVGGDIVSGEHIGVTVTAIGVLDGPLVTRAGALPGDTVAVCGRLGFAAAGLAVLQRGFRSPRVLVDAQRCPDPPYAEGPAAAAIGARAMIDVSDGLLADLNHIAEQSGVGLRIDPSRVPVATQLEQMARGLGVDVRAWVFGGGEDHALVACFPPAVELPSAWTHIGTVVEGSAVHVDGWDSMPEGLSGTSGGFDHFAR